MLPTPSQPAEAAAEPEAPRIGFVAASVYLVASSVLWVVGFVGVSALMLLGVVMSVTPIGPWVIALAVAAARGFGFLYRGLVLRLFGERLEPPAERTERGALAWRRFMLGGDGGGWAEAAFLSVRLPIALLNLIVGVGLWVYGLLWVVWPVLRNWDDLYTRQPDGTVRRRSKHSRPATRKPPRSSAASTCSARDSSIRRRRSCSLPPDRVASSFRRRSISALCSRRLDAIATQPAPGNWPSGQNRVPPSPTR